MPTFGEAYSEWLDEITGDGKGVYVGSISIGGAGEILKQHDPTAYRCGFVDWIDGLARDNMECPECGEEMGEETFSNADEETEMLCEVCASEGTKARCDDCGNVFSPIDAGGYCPPCAAKNE